MANLKELAKRPELLTGGHRMCAGCGAPIAVRMVLKAASATPLVVGCATGCLEVSTYLYPYSAWKTSFIHNAFENSAATISGVESAYRALKKRGRIKEEIKFIAFGGDGGTYDIGLQSLSGAMERGHNMLYVCYQNGAYMNTGIQRSSATPKGADTTTQPAGKVIQGKTTFSKDVTAIMVAHNIPYVAQASISNWRDLVNKVEKAMSIEGPKFLNVLTPCPLGWRFASKDTVTMAQLAVDTNSWPLYEVEDGKWTLNYKPKEIKPITDWMGLQGRFRHLKSPQNANLVKEIQDDINKQWQILLKKCGQE